MIAAEVCVIGAGALGLFTAYELAERGLGVLVVERDHPAAGSSGVSAGIIETQYLDSIDIEIRALSMHRFLQLEKDHGLEIVHNGYLRLGHDRAVLEVYGESVRIQKELGIDGPTVLEPHQIAEMLPGISTDDLTGGLFGPGDGYLDGDQLCNILKNLISDRNGMVLSQAPVVGLQLRTNGFTVAIAGDEINAESVVIAAGAWAPAIAAMVDVELPILPQRHQTCLLEPEPALAGLVPSVMDYVPGTGREGLYFRHEQPGQLLAGVHTEDLLHEVADPDAFATDSDAGYPDRVGDRFLARFPGHENTRVAPGWAGLYPMTPDRLALVGPYPAIPGLHICGGAGGSGIQSSPLYGRIAADGVIGRATLPHLALSLRPDRPMPLRPKVERLE